MQLTLTLAVCFVLCAGTCFTTPLCAQNTEGLKREIADFFRKNSTSLKPAGCLEKFQETYTNASRLTEHNVIPIFYPVTNRATLSQKIAIAFFTNKADGLFYIRIDSCVAGTDKIVRSTSPVVVSMSAGKIAVYDTHNLGNFSQTCPNSFHGFIQQSNASPDIITSVGPVGSANNMAFYRWKTRFDPNGVLEIKPLLLADFAHVKQFSIDLSQHSLRIAYFRDKWNPNSLEEAALQLR